MKHELRSAARLALLSTTLTLGLTHAPIAFAQTTQSAPAAASTSGPSLDERLAWLQKKLDQRRDELHIPGVAFALVKDDKVILSRGFGVSNVVSKAPVTDDSIFDIGSSTKAFTAMLCAMLVDQGKMDFDKPVTTYYPDFKLNTPEWTASTTMRDALAHRTGLTRTDMIWAANLVTRKEAIAQLQFAESFAPPRTAFLYNNMMFSVAGDAAALVAGADSWESMVTDQIFKPLGMNTTTPYTSKANTDPRRALGYAYDKATDQYRELPMRMLDACAPAGSICSNVKEMSQWLRFVLSKGEIDGKRLIKASLFDSDIWAPQMPMSPTSAYGLGWMLDKWRDKQCVHHGGNIDGYSAMVALLPDEHTGLVMLSNVTASALQEECKTLAWTALFGSEEDLRPASAQAGAKTEAELKPYLGKYDFALQHTQVTALVKDGKLCLDVPGQTVYALKWPNEKGRWIFELTDAIQVDFQTGDDGVMKSVTFYQGGQTYILPRVGEAKPAAAAVAAVGAKSEADLKPYLGKYDFALQKSQITAQIKDGKLALDVPGQTVYLLKSPNEKGRWVFELTDTIEVDFQPADDGTMRTLTMYQGGQTFVMPRVAGPDAGLPSASDLSAIVLKGQRGTPPQAFRISGTVNYVHQGLSGPCTIVADGDKYLMKFDFGKFGYISAGYDGQQAYVATNIGESKVLTGEEAAQIMSLHPRSAFDDPTKFYEKVEPLAWDTLNKVKAVKTKLTPKGARATIVWFDFETGHPLREEQERVAEDIGVSISTKMAYSDFKPLGNVDFPTTFAMENQFQGKAVMTFDKLEADVKIDPSEVALPASLKK